MAEIWLEIVVKRQFVCSLFFPPPLLLYGNFEPFYFFLTFVFNWEKNIKDITKGCNLLNSYFLTVLLSIFFNELCTFCFKFEKTWRSWWLFQKKPTIQKSKYPSTEWKVLNLNLAKIKLECKSCGKFEKNTKKNGILKV